MKIRMDRANELLRETKMPITDIATELGYSSHSHFTRAYRKLMKYLRVNLERRSLKRSKKLRLYSADRLLRVNE